jgi:ribonuclease HI
MRLPQYLKSSTEIDIGAIQMNQQTECNADALGALDSEVEQQRNEEISKLRKMVVQLQSQANEAAVWNQMARDELQERRREFSTIEAGLKSQLAGAIGELNSCKAALEETQKQYNVMQWVDSEYALAQCTNAWRHTEFDATEEVSICDYDAVIDEMEQRISRQVSVLQERLDLEIKNNLALSMQVAELSTLARRAHTHTQALQEKDSLIAELKSCVEQQQNELEQLTALLHVRFLFCFFLRYWFGAHIGRRPKQAVQQHLIPQPRLQSSA